MDFKFGTVSVPDGSVGDWRIDTINLSNKDVMMSNLRALRDNPIMYCPPGTYKRLVHSKRGTVMSNTQMEIETAREVMRHAQGDVLINGLGLGMVLEGILSKDNVISVKVCEIDQEVIDLVGPHFNDPRLKIVQADAYTYKPAKGERYNYIWHDIWDDINSDNLPLMAKLARKWARRAGAQGFWSKRQALEQRRKWGWN
jgi:predicted membrane-bound spermidine synthase